ncbi:hypothetical protein EIN_398030 [Entamoeba invadens IP1]|uniref:Uncharacterized protein n=1 Tax=Entamoeba invadens IP1 TaxID=370355 RepID=A0A0A1U9Y6_ENTIV|nr:hypothetical protein EIN_398030 [Entamoeba invadens IP1]ELP91873.1 hypothetical protein EIN_398030 [Entamoeba invadens IP1]|eukprot:XP_004258644.1 hypothetical protein EIN_398030 [Entamoeba invadens IP1]
MNINIEKAQKTLGSILDQFQKGKTDVRSVQEKFKDECDKEHLNTNEITIVLARRLHQFLTYYTKQPHRKTPFYYSCMDLLTRIFVGMDNSSQVILRMLLMEGTTSRYKKSLVKILSKYPLDKLQNACQVLVEMSYSRSSKLQKASLQILLQILPKRNYTEFLTSTSEKIVKVLSTPEILKKADFDTIIHLLRKSTLSQTLFDEVQNRFNGLKSDELRKLFHLVGGSYKDSDTRQTALFVLGLINNVPQILFETLDRFCDAPLISVISHIILLHPTHSPNEFCDCLYIDQNSSPSQFYAAARVFQNGLSISMNLSDSQILSKLSEKTAAIPVVDFLCFAPTMVHTLKDEFFTALQTLLRIPCPLYHGFSQTTLVVRCIARYFSKEACLLVADFLSDVFPSLSFGGEFPSQTVGVSADHAVRYSTNPHFEAIQKMSQIDLALVATDTLFSLLNFGSDIEMPLAKNIEESYLVPALAAKESLELSLSILVSYFPEDALRLFPLIVNKFWGDKSVHIHIALICALVELGAMLPIDSIDTALAKTHLPHGPKKWRSRANNFISSILGIEFDLDILSSISDIFVSELEKPHVTQRMASVIICGIILWMKEDVLSNPKALGLVFALVSTRYRQYEGDLIRVCISRPDIVEEAILIALKVVSMRNEKSSLRSIIQLLFQRKWIDGKRIFVGILGEVWNGERGLSELLKVLRDVTNWGKEWEVLRGICAVVLSYGKLAGEAELMRIGWLENEEQTRSNDVSKLTKDQFSKIYSHLSFEDSE